MASERSNLLHPSQNLFDPHCALQSKSKRSLLAIMKLRAVSFIVLRFDFSALIDLRSTA